jgi:hypothetical protein
LVSKTLYYTPTPLSVYALTVPKYNRLGVLGKKKMDAHGQNEPLRLADLYPVLREDCRCSPAVRVVFAVQDGSEGRDPEAGSGRMICDP